jgi:hypothetical protein
MLFRYQSGEEIKKGDRITFAGKPGEIEFVADPSTADPETESYIKEYGGGIMVLVAEDYGCVFISETLEEEDLVFMSRG